MDTLQMSQFTKNWSLQFLQTPANWAIEILAFCKKQPAVIDRIIDYVVHFYIVAGHDWPKLLQLEATKISLFCQIYFKKL